MTKKVQRSPAATVPQKTKSKKSASEQPGPSQQTQVDTIIIVGKGDILAPKLADECKTLLRLRLPKAADSALPDVKSAGLDSMPILTEAHVVQAKAIYPVSTSVLEYLDAKFVDEIHLDKIQRKAEYEVIKGAAAIVDHYIGKFRITK